jgi:hypothetical protein
VPDGLAPEWSLELHCTLQYHRLVEIKRPVEAAQTGDGRNPYGPPARLAEAATVCRDASAITPIGNKSIDRACSVDEMGETPHEASGDLGIEQHGPS